MATNIDDRLMNRDDQGAQGSSRADSQTATPEAAAAQPTLREAVQAEKRRRDIQAQKEAKLSGTSTGISGALASPLRTATSRLLRQAWLHLIDSFGLTLLWIDIHVFLSQVLGEKVFCKLGDEWTLNNSVAGAAGESVKAPAKLAEVGEPMGCCILNLAALFVFIAALSVIALIVKVIDNPLDAISTLLGWLWGSITGPE